MNDVRALTTAELRQGLDRDSGLHVLNGSVPSSGGIRAHRAVSYEFYPIAARISCVVVDSNGVVGSFIDSALK